VAISIQTTLGYRPLVAGLTLMPIYLVMMVGAPMAGRVADRIGHRAPILVGLTAYTFGLWMLSGIGPDSTLLSGVMPGILVLALGMATFTAPLVAATFGALDHADQGVASGVNNAMGQLAGLLAVAVLPAVAGLSGVPLSDPAFAMGHTAAMQIGAGLAATAMLVAVITFGPLGKRRAIGTGRRPAWPSR
jgi:MFS family permease